MALLAMPIRLALVATVQATVQFPSTDPAFRYIGRFDESDDGARFDRNGCEIQFQVDVATQLTFHMSQRLTASYNSTLNPVGSQPQHFLLYLNGKALSTPVAGSACSYCTFDTSNVANNTITSFVMNLTEPGEVRLMKTTEPEWNDREPSPNWVTFHGVSLGSGGVSAPGSARRSRRIEFLGDSITAGYCNLCHGPGPFDHSPTQLSAGTGFGQESFALSWPNVICETLGAECSTVAWSGLGLVRNCCGGETFMPEIFSRTLATEDAPWDFSKWVPDALVVNLGTNDGNVGATQEFVEGYITLVRTANVVYGRKLHVFLACGPMRETYCDSVMQTIANITGDGMQAHFLDQRGFLNGTFGSKCCGHPGAQVDAAMGAAGADFIAETLGWSTEAIV